jgi:hypothetical protein
MPCEWCSSDGRDCSVCGGTDWRTGRRYSAMVAAVCLIAFIVVVVVAAVCGVVNQLTAH